MARLEEKRTPSRTRVGLVVILVPVPTSQSLAPRDVASATSSENSLSGFW